MMEMLSSSNQGVMRNLYVVILVMLSFWAKAQTDFHAIDSLEDAAKRQEGEEKIRTLLSLSKEMRTLSFDDGVAVLEEAKEEAQRIGNKSLISRTNLDLAEAYIDNYDFDLADQYLRIALRNVGDDNVLKYDIYKFLALISLNVGNVDTASFYYEKSREAAKSLDDQGFYADAVNNLAQISRSKGNLEDALSGFEEAVNLYYEMDDSLSAARSLNNIAMLYYARQQYDEAMSIFYNLIPFFERRGDNVDLSMVYSNMGLIKSRYNGDIDTSLILLDKAKHYAILGNDSLTMVDVLLNEGDLYLMKEDFEGAFTNFEEALQIASRLSYNEGLASTYVRLSEGNYLLGNYVEAIDNIKSCMEIEDRTGQFLYTPLLKPYLMMSYAHAGMYDSLESEVVRTEEGYNELLAEKMELEQDMEDMALLEESNDALEAENVRLRYVVAGLATLLVVLAVYTLVSGRSRKEK